MKASKLLLLALITILLSFSLSFLFYTTYFIQDIYELDMKMKIGNVVGFDTNTSVISFGVVPKEGGASQRTVIIKNMENKPLTVRIITKGEMAEWIHIPEKNFIIAGDEKKEVIFTAIPSKDAKEREYKGKTRFVFSRVI